MSDNTRDGRPPRKAGAGQFRGKPGAGRPGAGKPGGKRFAGKPGSGKPGADKPFRDKPFRDATSGERPVTGRNAKDRPAGGRPFRGKPEGGKSAAGKSFAGKSLAGKPFGDRPRSDRPDSGRPARPASFGARPFTEGDSPEARPARSRPEGSRPERGDRPARRFDGKPGERPRPDRARPDRPRPDRGSSDRPRPERGRDERPAREGSGSRGDLRRDAGGPARAQRADASEAFAPRAEANAAHGAGRIAKVIARAGACSRRDAEAWILEGRVSVNGEVLTSPAHNVNADDRIAIDGKPLASRERTRLFLFNKPRGLVTTNSDPEGRPTIFDALPDNVPRLISVGRLDINTEGLMLLTNDGGLARVLELPATGWLRRYRVRAHGETDQAQLDRLMEGVSLDGIDYRGIDAKIDREQGANLWLTVGLREGKNREVKRVLESLGLEVNRLIRISFGPFQLAELGEGAVEEVGTRILKDQLGERLALEAGADFDAPVFERRGEEVETYTVQSTGRGRRYEDDAVADERPARAPRRSGPRDGEPTERRPGTPPQGKRKHVTALREISREKETRGARLRIETSATEDRKGRAVKVERRVAPARGEEAADLPDTRNARRFAGERGERPPRREWSERPPGRAGRPETRAPRPEGREDSRGPRRDSRPRDGDRPQRSRPEGGRPEGGSSEGRKSEGRTTYAARSSAPRSAPPRSEREGKSFGGKSFGGGRPAGNKPGGPSRGGKPGGPPRGAGPGRGGDRPPRRPRDK